MQHPQTSRGIKASHHKQAEVSADQGQAIVRLLKHIVCDAAAAGQMLT